MEAPACTPPVPFDATDEEELEIEIATDLPEEVADAFATVAEWNLSPDHAFLLGVQLLNDYVVHHIEQVTDLSDEMASANVTAELTEEERIGQLGALAVWAADQGRLEAALDLLHPLIVAANDPGEEGEGEEEAG
jgi:hypothetical protein